MTTTDKIARRKLSLLDLASELSNVSRACKVMGYSRQQFYEIRRNFQTYGADGLIDRLPGARGPHPNRVSSEIETAILDHALEHPCHGATRVEQELRLKGVQVSSGGVRGVWQRHNMLAKHERLLRLEKATAERKVELKEDQIKLLERFSPDVLRLKNITDLTALLTDIDGDVVVRPIKFLEECRHINEHMERVYIERKRNDLLREARLPFHFSMNDRSKKAWIAIHHVVPGGGSIPTTGWMS